MSDAKTPSGKLEQKLEALAAKRGEPATTDNASSEQKAADDWLAAFAKKSQEALAKRDAEKQTTTPRPDDKVLIERLARKDHTEYDRMRADLAETLGIRVGTLDDKVEAIRKKLAVEDDEEALPHWKVELWPEPVDGNTLLDSIRRVFRRYIVLPSCADIVLPLWVLHAWTIDACEISPFLLVVSPTKRCGKTSVMILLYFLVLKAELASNISPSAIFRHIERTRPTLLIDEGDSFLKDNEEVRGILDAGHTKIGASVMRNVEVGGEIVPRRFSVWAAKAIAVIGKLADTLDDRGIKIPLQRKPPSAKIERLRRRDSEEFATLRRQAARWASDNLRNLIDPEPQVPEQLNDRAADNWRPLLAIAELAGGEWPDRARRAALVLSGESPDGAIGVELLKDIRLAFGEDEAMRSADLVAKLVEDPERPWADWSHGRALTQKQLGRLLSPFCICSETVSVPGLKDAKGYKRIHFEGLWEAYCPVKTPSAGDSDVSKRRTVVMPVKSAQVDGFRSVAEGSGDASKNANLSYSHAGSDASTLQNGGNGAEGCSDQKIAAPSDPDDPYGIPASCRRCFHCGEGGAVNLVILPDGRQRQLHRECEAPWFATHDKSHSHQPPA
jgi:putative DNA primase/helicase